MKYENYNSARLPVGPRPSPGNVNQPGWHHGSEDWGREKQHGQTNTKLKKTKLKVSIFQK